MLTLHQTASRSVKCCAARMLVPFASVFRTGLLSLVGDR